MLSMPETVPHPVVSSPGTFITEWDAGSAVCEDLLASEATVEAAVRQLARIALHHGFEGWLINIENKVPPAKVSGDLLYLCYYCSMRLRTVILIICIVCDYEYTPNSIFPNPVLYVCCKAFPYIT